MVVQRQSEPILRFVDSSQAVEDSATVHGGPIVAPILEKRFDPQNTVLIADGETEDGQPIFRAVIYSLRDELTASREGLLEVEKRHLRLKRRVTELSNERVVLFDRLAADYTWLRGTLEKRLGSDDADALAGFQAPTATRSTALLRQVELAADALSAAELELPGDRLDAFRFDPGETAEKLRSKAQRYRELLAEIRRVKREVDVTQKAKDRTIEAHKKIFLPIARTLEALYRLAGEDELAAKVRPSVVQRGRRAVEVEESPEGGSVTTDRETSTDSESPADGASNGEPSPEAEAAAPSAVTASTSAEVGGCGGDLPAPPAETPAGAGSSDA